MIFNLPPICGLFPLLLYIVLAFKNCGRNHGETAPERPGRGDLRVHGLLPGPGGIHHHAGLRTGHGAEKDRRSRRHRQCADAEDRRPYPEAGYDRHHGLFRGAGHPAGHFGRCQRRDPPIVIPLVAAVGITPSALAVIFQGAGQNRTVPQPLLPPMVTLMSITGLSYPRLLLCAGLPVSIVMWVGTFLIANKVQKETQGTENFGPDGEAAAENFQMDPATRRATIAFAVTMALMVIYGIATNGGASFVILVMIVAAIITGLFARMPVGTIFDSMMEGCGKMMWLFFMFLILTPS